MKWKYLLFIILYLMYGNAKAQISKPIPVYSFHHFTKGQIQTIEMPEIDVQKLLEEDKEASDNKPFRFGYKFKV